MEAGRIGRIRFRPAQLPGSEQASQATEVEQFARGRADRSTDRQKADSPAGETGETLGRTSMSVVAAVAVAVACSDWARLEILNINITNSAGVRHLLTHLLTYSTCSTYSTYSFAKVTICCSSSYPTLHHLTIQPCSLLRSEHLSLPAATVQAHLMPFSSL